MALSDEETRAVELRLVASIRLLHKRRSTAVDGGSGSIRGKTVCQFDLKEWPCPDEIWAREHVLAGREQNQAALKVPALPIPVSPACDTRPNQTGPYPVATMGIVDAEECD